MHQNLIDLPDLDERVRLQALSELGQDYLKAGLLDRAEEIFNKLLGSSFEEEAKRNLLEIYQVEKEWLKAVEIARELPDVASHREIAEYYCELAANEIMRSRPDTAREYLDVAMQENRKCVRASLLHGDLLLQEGKAQEAIAAWQRIEQQDPAYLALVAQRLLETHRKLERLAEGIALLSGYLERYPSLDLLDVVYQLVLESDGTEAAYRLVRDELQRNPTLLGLEKLMSARCRWFRLNSGRMWSWPRASSRATPSACRAIGAIIAVSRPASSTGAVRPVAAGKPTAAPWRRIRSIPVGSFMKITVVGTGYVGLVSGTCLAEVGNDVLCLDVDPEKIRILRKAASRSTSRACRTWSAATWRPAACISPPTSKRPSSTAPSSSSPSARRPMKTARPTCSTCCGAARNIGRLMTDYKVSSTRAPCRWAPPTR
jgi:tetratricopeptide (TPR) repeat protein